MNQQTNGMPDLKHSEETFRDMYEALKRLLTETSILDNENCDHDVGMCWCSYKNARFAANHALDKAEGK